MKVKALKTVWNTTQILLSYLKTPHDECAAAGGWFYEGQEHRCRVCGIIYHKYASPIHKPDSWNALSKVISCIAAQIRHTLAWPSQIWSRFGSEILKIVSPSSPVLKHLCTPEDQILDASDKRAKDKLHTITTKDRKKCCSDAWIAAIVGHRFFQSAFAEGLNGAQESASALAINGRRMEGWRAGLDPCRSWRRRRWRWWKGHWLNTCNDQITNISMTKDAQITHITLRSHQKATSSSCWLNYACCRCHERYCTHVGMTDPASIQIRNYSNQMI